MPFEICICITVPYRHGFNVGSPSVVIISSFLKKNAACGFGDLATKPLVRLGTDDILYSDSSECG